MKTAQILSLDLDDVIFNGRHKDFGAYDIRKHYSERLKRALLITFGLWAMLVSIPFAVEFFTTKEITVIATPKYPPIDPFQYPQIKQKLQTKHAEQAKATHGRREELVQHPDNPQNPSGNQNQHTTNGNGNSTIVTVPSDSGTHIILPHEEDDEIPNIEDVEQQPCFAGGIDAIGSWIQSHTIYPEQAIDLNIYGKVYVSITIDEDGKVISTEIVKGVHKLLNEAALNVAKKIPFGCGAKQNGHKVKVNFIAPVNFRIQT